MSCIPCGTGVIGVTDIGPLAASVGWDAAARVAGAVSTPAGCAILVAADAAAVAADAVSAVV
eukprot:5393673-Alexandrium_andersonii.AAC.1